MDERPLRVGDRVELRKPHACGGNTWTIVRVGADLRVQCDQCGRSVMLPRDRLERAIRRRVEPPAADQED